MYIYIYIYIAIRRGRPRRACVHDRRWWDTESRWPASQRLVPSLFTCPSKTVPAEAAGREMLNRRSVGA